MRVGRTKWGKRCLKGHWGVMRGELEFGEFLLRFSGDLTLKSAVEIVPARKSRSSYNAKWVLRFAS